MLDGNTKEWTEDDLITSGNCGDLYMMSDERYVYFMVQLSEDFDYQFEKDTLLIPIDTISEQGNTKMNDTGTTFDSAADFVSGLTDGTIPGLLWTHTTIRSIFLWRSICDDSKGFGYCNQRQRTI